MTHTRHLIASCSALCAEILRGSTVVRRMGKRSIHRVQIALAQETVTLPWKSR
jgi:hypothetical protein